MTITFDDIGGLGEQKQSIRETILLPLKHMDSLRQYSALLCPPTGVLFYGPPGTGKTLMAKAIGNPIIHVCAFFFVNKKVFREMILLPLRHMNSLRQYRTVFCPPFGVLFYGPPDTGKNVNGESHW